MADNNAVLYLTHTNREWKIIDTRIKELGSKDFNRYLNSKISSLMNDYNNCTECVCDALVPNKKTRKKRISPALYEKLKEISEQANLPISTIIDKLIVTPLLIEK